MQRNGKSNINLRVAVKNAGYLKEAYIDFRDEQNGTDTNYEILEDASNTTLVQNVNKDLKTISLNYIDYGTDAIIQMPISLPLENLMEISKLKQNSLITLRGIYVDRNGKEVEISKTIKLNLGWTLETELEVEQSVEKYISYTDNEKTGMLLQIAVKAKQNRDDFVLPVKSSEIKLKVPEIAETLPEKIIVVADETLATNGDRIEFTKDNWEYNEQEKTITIKTQGYEEDGRVLAGIGEDTYLVTYMYPAEAINNEMILPSNIEAKMELYSAEGIIEKTSESNEDIVLDKEIGDTVTYNIKAIEKELSKGRMYANTNSDIKTYDTEYKTVVKANVSNSNALENITMELTADEFVKEEKTYPIYNNYYKELIINKAKMQKILGEDGFVNIFDGTNTYTINKDTKDIDGNYVISYEDGISNLTVQTSKPIEDGIFRIDVTKTISKDLTYSKAQLQGFDSLKINAKDAISDTITLKETSTNAKLEISQVNLVSSTENKDVNFKIMLNNSSENSDLYKNAVFEIALPKYVEDIYGVANILYTSGLKIDNIEKVNTENGMVLRITTAGAESLFSDGVITNGSVITIDATLKIGEVAEDISDKIVFTYTNESAVSYENEGKEEIAVNFIARPKTESLTTSPETVTNPESTVDPDAKATLEVSTKAIYQGAEITSSDSIKEKQEIKYVTTIKNTSTINAESVVLSTNLQNGNILSTAEKILDSTGKEISSKDKTMDEVNVTEFTFTWNNIPAGYTAVLECTAFPSDIEEISGDNKKVTNVVKVTAGNVEEEIENTVENNLTEAKLYVQLSIEDNTIQFENNDEIRMYLHIENISEETINNIVATYTLPEGLEYIKNNEDQQITYNEATRTITINIDKIDSNDATNETIKVKVNIPNNIGKMKTLSTVKVKADEVETYCSNALKINMAAPVLSIDLSSNIANGSYIKEGQAIEINGIAKNTDGVDSSNLNISINVPERFIVQEATYTLDDGTTGKLTAGSENKYYFLTGLKVGQSAKFKIVGTTEVKHDLDEEEVSFIATLDEANKKSISSNTLTYKVEKTTTNPDKPNPDKPAIKTYKISGKAWLDENKDGKKDENEKLLEGINVLLIDAKTGVIVTDRTNGTVKETKTSANGEYTFTNLLEGSYMVIFEYDSAYYDVTEYSKAGITEDLSSKAIQTQINKDGNLKTAGVTNTIIISNSSISNVNIGLVERAKFDLSLEKQISKVTIDNKAGSKTYTFENGKLAKIDIPAGNLDSTTATIEYKMIIKNNGAVAGSAKKIIDYIPNDLHFDEVINAGWYKGEDGNLYNNTLTNTIINPGESKELTLILTKKMTGENTGTILNRAEIYEDYNEFGYSDYNSTPGNKAQGENDLGYAELIITVKTGQVVMYITIALISIGIIALGAFEINKKVLKGGLN